MKILFQTAKSKETLLLKLILVSSLPGAIITLLLGISENFDAYYWVFAAPFCFLAVTIPFSVRVFTTHRYYIQKLVLNENALEIDYLFWFRKKRRVVEKSAVHLRQSDYRRELKYLEIVQGDKRLIKQAPFAEWREQDRIVRQLKKEGFVFKSYW